MSVTSQRTPNPNALKFSVGVEVGGPRSYIPANAADDPVAGLLLGIEGIVSVFMTADFITVTKSAEADWSEIIPQAQATLEERYAGS